MSDDTDEPFGFSVKLVRHWDTDEPRGWVVELPHQCGSWKIAGDDEFDQPGLDHAEAVAEMERFLAEGAAALEALKAKREIAEP